MHTFHLRSSHAHVEYPERSWWRTWHSCMGACAAGALLLGLSLSCSTTSPSEDPQDAAVDTVPVSDSHATGDDGVSTQDGGGISAAGHWPMWRHNVRHTGSVSLIGPSTEPRLVWEADTCCFGMFSSPSVDLRGNIYVGTKKNAEPEDGVCDYLSHPVAKNSGMLNALSADGTSLPGFPFDSNTGSVMASSIEVSPLLLNDGTIVFGKDDGYVYALGPDGSLKWSARADDTFNPSKPGDDNEQFIPSPIIDPQGRILAATTWSDVYGAGTTADAACQVCGVCDLFADETRVEWGKLYAFDVNDGRRLWTFDPSEHEAATGPLTFWGSPALLSDERIVVTTYGSQMTGSAHVPTRGRIFALHTDGSADWVYPPVGADPEGLIWGTPIIGTDDTIYVAISSALSDQGAKVVALTAGGELKWEWSGTEDNTIIGMSLSDKGLVFGTQRRFQATLGGRLYSLRIADGSPEVRWVFPATGLFELGMYSPPVVDAKGQVFFATGAFPQLNNICQQGRLHGVNDDGNEMWSKLIGDCVHAEVILVPSPDASAPPRLIVAPQHHNHVLVFSEGG